MADSANGELEKLQKRKEELKSKLEAILRDRNTLQEGIRILREKAAIRELEEKVREEQNMFSKLSFLKMELEERLNQPSRFSMIDAVEKAKTEQEDKEDVFGTRETEQIEATWKKSEEESESDKEPEEQEKAESDKEPEEQESKKKLRFF